MLLQETREEMSIVEEAQRILNTSTGGAFHNGECCICAADATHHCIQCRQAICTAHRRVHLVPNGFLGLCPGCYIRMTANTQPL